MEREYALVIGASGFIGKNLVEELCLDKYFIVATYASLNNIDCSKAIPYQLDLSDRIAVHELLFKYEFKLIFYLSSVTNVDKAIKNPLLDQVNLTHMLIFLEELRSTDYFQRTKVIYASSGGTVYGNQLKLPISEDVQLDPLSPYGITKMSIEAFLKYYHRKYGMNYVVLRYANPYGRYQDPNSGTGVPNIFLYKTLVSEPVYVVGDPKEILRDYIYITDAVDITIRIAEADNRECVYNIGFGVGCSLFEIMKIIESRTKKEIKCVRMEAGEGLVKRVVLDVSRVNREFKWEAKVSLEEGIQRDYFWILEWMKLEGRVL